MHCHYDLVVHDSMVGISILEDLGQICSRYVISSPLHPYTRLSSHSYTHTHTLWKFVFDFTEGFLTSCTFDYLSDEFDNRVFVGTLFTFSYCIPMLLIIYFYSQIVSHVFSHEKALRAQAKKMNVESLRTNTGTSSAEVRIAKAAITICFLFVACNVYTLISFNATVNIFATELNSDTDFSAIFQLGHRMRSYHWLGRLATKHY